MLAAANRAVLRPAGFNSLFCGLSWTDTGQVNYLIIHAAVLAPNDWHMSGTSVINADKHGQCFQMTFNSCRTTDWQTGNRTRASVTV
jgi:hypothetical protein